MADQVKISALPAATTPLAGTEEAVIVQGGQSRRVAVSEFAGSVAVFGQGSDGLVPGPSSGDVSANRLLQADGSWVDPPTTFSQDVAGLVPGPTASDVSNNRLLQANGAWVDPPSGGGMNQAGAGTFSVTGTGANAGGRCDSGTVTVDGSGALFSGYKAGPATLNVSGEGATVLGLIVSGTVDLDADGTFAMTYHLDGSLTNPNGNTGASFMGHMQGSSTAVVLQGDGTSVRGHFTGGTVTVSGSGARFRGRSITSGTCTVSGSAAVFDGLTQNGATTTLSSDVARFEGANVGGTVLVDSTAAKASGYLDNASAVMNSTGLASFVHAYIPGAGTAEATANGSWQIGIGSCTVANAFQLGAGVLHCRFEAGSETFAMFGATPVAQQSDPASPAADTGELKTAVDALRTIMLNYGMTA